MKKLGPVNVKKWNAVSKRLFSWNSHKISASYIIFLLKCPSGKRKEWRSWLIGRKSVESVGAWFCISKALFNKCNTYWVAQWRGADLIGGHLNRHKYSATADCVPDVYSKQCMRFKKSSSVVESILLCCAIALQFSPVQIYDDKHRKFHFHPA